MRVVAFDSETFYIKPTPKDPGYSVQSLGNWRYTNDSRFDCYFVSVYDGEEAWVGQPKDLNWDALEGARLISHNASFDQAVYRRMVEIGQAPRVNYADWSCSANLTSFLCNRRSLAASAEHLLKVSVPKGMRDWMNRKHWSDAVADGKADALMNYARNDVIHCWNIWNRFSCRWPAFERDLSALTIRQCSRGVAIDVDKLQRYRAEIGMAIFTLEKSMPWVPEGAKPTSTNAVAAECRKSGIPCPPVKSREGEEAFLEWEATYAPQFAWVMAVSQWRSLVKVQSAFDTIYERLRPDNTIDFSLLYFGAHTGRFSGGGAGLNMQNLRKDPIYIADDYTVSETKIENPREVIDVRSLFIPRPGHKFIICDLAQIEPRVLNWLCGNFELLERLRGGMSIYEAHARETMGWTGGELKKENPAIYKAAKARCLAEGTPVFTSRGYLPIEEVLVTDKVWDGTEFVEHQGVVCNGYQETIRIGGEAYTRDHLIFSEERLPKQAGLLSEGEQAVAMAWRHSSAGWEDLWALASFVARHLPKEFALICSLSVRRVWERLRRGLAQSPGREDE